MQDQRPGLPCTVPDDRRYHLWGPVFRGKVRHYPVLRSPKQSNGAHGERPGVIPLTTFRWLCANPAAINPSFNQVPLMPQFCMGRQTDPLREWNCVIQVGNTYGAPYFKHTGGSDVRPQVGSPDMLIHEIEVDPTRT